MIERDERALAVHPLSDDVLRVCGLIPPLWDLPNYVAVNPFLGFVDSAFDASAAFISDGLGASVLPGLEFYRARWLSGAFGSTDLSSAARHTGGRVSGLEAMLTGRATIPLRDRSQVLTFAERHDAQHQTNWNDAVVRSCARWCAVHASKGSQYWGMTAKDGMFESWREVAGSDPSLDIAGLRGFREWTKQIPAGHASGALDWALNHVAVDASERVAYLYRLLGGLYGWASYFRRTSWESGGQEPGPLVDLLAIRACMDGAVYCLNSRASSGSIAAASQDVPDESTLLVFQNALEDGYVRGLLGKLNHPDASAAPIRPELDAVFCIDVRSEPLRRHLEANSTGIRTRGFAGFFGVAMNWRSTEGDSARCPVLLKPAVTVGSACAGQNGVTGSALLHMQTAPAASFSFVETLGMMYGLRLAADTMVAGSSSMTPEGDTSLAMNLHGTDSVMPSAARVELAASILKNMGFGKSFARIVLLCGHEGHSSNNPHQAGLDCGACGGHSGAINARVAAALLNDQGVRAGLTNLGWMVPSDTHFLPGVHHTSTDEVRLLDLDQVPADHRADLTQLRDWLAQASAKTRAERASALGLEKRPTGILKRLLQRRAADWSEVRPEWALARNAAFIAARRSRTRGVNLEGRSFLHEYDATADTDDSILTLILTAPMVVASWINLQYFASTVDNRTFGCGDKALHNRVGSLGVVLGNGGDLRTGLPLQSVHSADGRWFHEPLRLQVVVEAPTTQIDRVLRAQPGVWDLVNNGWVRLFALSPDDCYMERCLPGSGWERMDVNQV
ncbi:MAG: DUF2309 domain-containing protein [Planctomycetota bacterium]|nr:DUF2309 domain-containing protein [Planctomycetota bacterium]